MRGATIRLNESTDIDFEINKLSESLSGSGSLSASQQQFLERMRSTLSTIHAEGIRVSKHGATLITGQEFDCDGAKFFIDAKYGVKPSLFQKIRSRIKR